MRHTCWLLIFKKVIVVSRPVPCWVVVVVHARRDKKVLAVKKQAILDDAKNSRISDGGRRWVPFIQHCLLSLSRILLSRKIFYIYIFAPVPFPLCTVLFAALSSNPPPLPAFGEITGLPAAAIVSCCRCSCGVVI